MAVCSLGTVVLAIGGGQRVQLLYSGNNGSLDSGSKECFNEAQAANRNMHITQAFHESGHHERPTLAPRYAHHSTLFSVPQGVNTGRGGRTTGHCQNI